MQGKIIKISSHSSEIMTKDNYFFIAFMKGKLKRDVVPCVGDDVEFEQIDNNKANIVDILPRKNLIYRPRIANVDQIIIVTSLFKPLFSSYILNKYIILCEASGITPILVFTKIDLLKIQKQFIEVMEKINWYKQLNFTVLVLDNKNFHECESDLEHLKSLMETKVSCFVGQTGAGKSSTINNFLLEQKIKTNEISEKLNRGKHTTTSVSLYTIKNNITIADTPGFSSFTILNVDLPRILKSYSIFQPWKKNCAFLDCKHYLEKDCGIKHAINDKHIPQFIYNDYVKVLQEIEARRKTY